MHKHKFGLGIEDKDKQIVREYSKTKHRNSGSESEANQHNNMTSSPWRGAVWVSAVLVKANKSAIRTLHSPGIALKKVKSSVPL